MQEGETTQTTSASGSEPVPGREGALGAPFGMGSGLDGTESRDRPPPPGPPGAVPSPPVRVLALGAGADQPPGAGPTDGPAGQGRRQPRGPGLGAMGGGEPALGGQTKPPGPGLLVPVFNLFVIFFF